VVDVAPWQPYEQVADQFRCGRVFLVGDSAHTMPPFKGGGANTAIQSAHNLAWKIAAVHSGTAGPGLLETYRAERHPVGRFAARQSLTGPAAQFLHLGHDRPTLPADEELSMFYMIAGYKYRSSAVVTDGPAPVDADAVELVDGEQLRGEPGTRVPHGWLAREGVRVSTLDLLGSGFTLFTGSTDAPWRRAAKSVSASLGIPIDVQRLGAQFTWLPAEGALLVRPDDFVAWRAHTMPRSPETDLRGVLCRILAT
jgi:putative polyketide hydroxylase